MTTNLRLLTQGTNCIDRYKYYSFNSLFRMFYLLLGGFANTQFNDRIQLLKQQTIHEANHEFEGK